MTGILLLGFLIGMQHAFEADHVAAMSSVIASGKSVGGAMRHGLGWGLGHALMLGAVAGVVIGFGVSLTDWWSRVFEIGVGVMLVVLGSRVLFRLVRERAGWHLHRHSDGTVHFHIVTAESETAGNNPNNDKREHAHRHGLPMRAVAIGMMHGLAGSGAVFMLAVAGLERTWEAVSYVLLFGAGSMVGMGVLSTIVALPLAWTTRGLAWGNIAIQGLIGAVSVLIGLAVATENALALM